VAGIVFHHGGNVLVQHSGQLGSAELTMPKPVWIIASPDQAMPGDLHFMRLDETHNFVSLAEIKAARIPTHHSPFHRVFRLNPVDLSSEGRSVADLGELRRSDRGPDQHTSSTSRLPKRWLRTGSKSSEHDHRDCEAKS